LITDDSKPDVHESGTRRLPTPGGAGTELSVETRVESLDGSERKLLLYQLARAHPDVVEAGFELLAKWRSGT
jgi:hypothetical protein